MVVEVTTEELAILLGHPDWKVEHVNPWDQSDPMKLIHVVFYKPWQDDGS
jgi:hypothetical protein